MSPAGPYRISDKDLLRRIARSTGQRAGYKQLVREMGMGGGRERRLLLEQLARLTARGELTKIDRETWSIPKTTSSRDNLAAGRLDLHRDGYGFVRPEVKQASGEEDIFIPPNEIGGAMQGDQVLVELAPPSRDGRRSGRIVRVLNRRNPTVVGIFHYAGRGRRGDHLQLSGNYVTPLDERMTQPILIPPGCEVPPAGKTTPHRVLGAEALAQVAEWDDLEGLAVDVEVTHWPTLTQPARGKVIEVLGEQDAFGVDVEIIIRKHRLPHVFPENVLAEAREEAQQTVATLEADELAARRDFRHLPIVTIDGETARDFDDAVYATPLPNGNMQLQVHIADVVHYVREGTMLDLEARLRGTSVYFPDRAIPMLPQELSTGICSLRPQEDRLVLSCLMEIDQRGEVLGYEVCEGIICSARRMTYTQVQAVIDGDAEARAEFAALLPEFERMHELSLLLNKKRVRRGSIDFDLPEPLIEFDELGAMQGVVRSQRKWAHRLIEEFMLAANECVATWLEHQAIPSIYRIHEKPEPKKVVEFEDTAAGFGYSLGLGNLPVRRIQTRGDRRDQRGSGRAAKMHEVTEDIPVTPRMYQKLTEKISGKPEERILAYLMLRSLRQARYSEKNEGHFALAAPSYTHFTSPIRRYPDLIVHRILKQMLRAGTDPRGAAVLSDAPNPWMHRKTPGAPSFAKQRAGEGESLAGPIPESELAAIAQETSLTERRADEAERELIEWKKIKFMQDRVGEDFDAMILSATKYGLFVELDGLFVEGLVPLSALTGDYYTFRENTRQICGERFGHCYGMGQKVRVLLDRVDRTQRRLQFSILNEPQADQTPQQYKKFKKQKPAATATKRKTKDRSKKSKGKRR
ncbi:MAG: ribonuclease R family protein [Acidobacteriaceae bacterium]